MCRETPPSYRSKGLRELTGKLSRCENGLDKDYLEGTDGLSPKEEAIGGIWPWTPHRQCKNWRGGGDWVRVFVYHPPPPEKKNTSHHWCIVVDLLYINLPLHLCTFRMMHLPNVINNSLLVLHSLHFIWSHWISQYYHFILWVCNGPAQDCIERPNQVSK